MIACHINDLVVLQRKLCVKGKCKCNSSMIECTSNASRRKAKKINVLSLKAVKS